MMPPRPRPHPRPRAHLSRGIPAAAAAAAADAHTLAGLAGLVCEATQRCTGTSGS